MKFCVKISNTGHPTLNGIRGHRVGFGIAREVYRCGRYVVKVSQRNDDEQNQIEWNKYRSLSRPDRKFFARVHKKRRTKHWSYVVQTYITHHEGMRRRRHWNIIRHLERRLSICDMSRENWYVTKGGHIKIIDLGYCK